MTKKYALGSTQGGVGKTTLTANLGAILAYRGQKRLIFDADHCQSLSAYYPIAKKADQGLRQQLTTANAVGCISRTAIPNLDIVLSDDPEKSLNNWVRQSSSHFQSFHAALASIDDGYALVVIDTKGSDGAGALKEIAIQPSATQSFFNSFLKEVLHYG